MRIILKFKYVFTKNTLPEKAAEIWKSGKSKKNACFHFFGNLNNNNDHNTFLSFHHIKGDQHNLKTH